MADGWDTYAICPGCDTKYRAPFGDTFHLHFKVCPHCGEPKPELSWSALGRMWPVRTMRYVSTGRLFKPSTWGTGHWESYPLAPPNAS